MFVDTHAHLTMPEFADLSGTIGRARDYGVRAIIDVGYDLESSEKSTTLAKDNEILFSAIGIHPHDAKNFDAKMINKLKVLAQKPKVVAIGETGLDYHYKLSTPDEQKRLFVEMIKLSREFGLPMIVHGRESYDDIIDIIDTEGKGDVQGVFHSFSGDLVQAEWAIKNRFYIAFSGMLTFKKASNIIEIATAVPLEHILIETDCPYLTPEPFRGKRNEPAYVKYVAEKLANIKGTAVEDIGRITTQNAEALFKL